MPAFGSWDQKRGIEYIYFGFRKKKKSIFLGGESQEFPSYIHFLFISFLLNILIICAKITFLTKVKIRRRLRLKTTTYKFVKSKHLDNIWVEVEGKKTFEIEVEVKFNQHFTWNAHLNPYSIAKTKIYSVFMTN